MKRSIAILAACSALVLSACSSKPATPEQSAPAAETAVAQSAEPAESESPAEAMAAESAAPGAAEPAGEPMQITKPEIEGFAVSELRPGSFQISNPGNSICGYSVISDVATQTADNDRAATALELTTGLSQISGAEIKESSEPVEVKMGDGTEMLFVTMKIARDGVDHPTAVAARVDAETGSVAALMSVCVGAEKVELEEFNQVLASLKLSQGMPGKF
ncbi:MAG: hypothetical protein Q3999_04245 [Buchananella hordeovulneris]|nr:hypothetical protein [Buchananella hordeovulneris]